jgi:hypothetical protein
LFGRWLEQGFAPDSFWIQTPRRLSLAIAARARTENRRHDERMHHAWHAGVIARAAEVPDLRTLMINPPEPRAASPDEIEAACRMWLGSPKADA